MTLGKTVQQDPGNESLTTSTDFAHLSPAAHYSNRLGIGTPRFCLPPWQWLLGPQATMSINCTWRSSLIPSRTTVWFCIERKYLDFTLILEPWVVGQSPTPTKNGRSGVKPIPGFVPSGYIIVSRCDVNWAWHEASSVDHKQRDHREELNGPFLRVLNMATQSGSIYRFGCGNNITSQPADRRALNNPRCERVVKLWKAFAEAGVENVDEFLSQSAAKICRKCFYVYDKYSKHHDITEENLKKVVKVLKRSHTSSGAQPLPNWHRVSSTQS